MYIGMWNLFLIFGAVIYLTNGLEELSGYQDKTVNKYLELDKTDLFNSDRRSIYAKWPDQRSMLDRAGYAKNYLNQPVKVENPRPATLTDILKPFPKKEEQSQYLHPDSETFRVLRRNEKEGITPNEAETNEERARDASMKSKIALIVEQTLHDAEDRLKSIAALKDKYKSHPSFKIGFMMIMIKKSRDVMNELFNVAVKHREQWQALEQLKIFELIIHTNADTTILVQELMDLNAGEGSGASKHNPIVK